MCEAVVPTFILKGHKFNLRLISLQEEQRFASNIVIMRLKCKKNKFPYKTSCVYECFTQNNIDCSVFSFHTGRSIVKKYMRCIK